MGAEDERIYPSLSTPTALTSTDLLGDGTDLYRRTMAEDYGDADMKALQAKVWSPTPWMIDVYEGYGQEGTGRERMMRNWLNSHFGRESSPIHGWEGVWHRGNVTMYGWTWYGFKTEAMMNEFQTVFPSPNA